MIDKLIKALKWCGISYDFDAMYRRGTSESFCPLYYQQELVKQITIIEERCIGTIKPFRRGK